MYHFVCAPRQSCLPPVVVVCGDHGMSEAGSHGGASAPETQVALHFISDMYSGQPQVSLHDLAAVSSGRY